MDLSENAKLARLRIKSRAREALNGKGTVLSLLLGSFALLITAFAVELAEGAVYYSFVANDRLLEYSVVFTGMLTAIFDTVTYFVIPPMLLGLYRIAAGAVHAGKADLRDLLYYWRPKKYFRAVIVYTLVVGPWHIYSLAVTALYQALPMIVGTGWSTTAAYTLWMAEIVAFFAVLGIGFLLAFCYCRLYSVIAAVVCGEGSSVFFCIAAAFRATKKRAWRIFVFRLSFIPVILLGFASIGIILFIFTVPYMLISYFYYNAELFGVDTESARMTEVTFDER